MSISEEIRNCELCPLSKKLDMGFKPLPGSGSPKSKILFIYDYPTHDDYLTQTSLAGRNGLFFDKIIQQAELSRKEIYITSLVKCYTSCAKDGLKNIKSCSPWLDKQQTALNPLVIIASGQVAISYALKINKNKVVMSEITKTTIIQNDTLIIPLPGLFTLMNLGKSIVEYHVDRIRKAKTWVSKAPSN